MTDHEELKDMIFIRGEFPARVASVIAQKEHKTVVLLGDAELIDSEVIQKMIDQAHSDWKKELRASIKEVEEIWWRHEFGVIDALEELRNKLSLSQEGEEK